MHVRGLPIEKEIVMARTMEDPSKKFIAFVDELEVPKASNTWNITSKNAACVIAIFNRWSITERGGMGTAKAKYSLSIVGTCQQSHFHLKRIQRLMNRVMVLSIEQARRT